MSSQRDLKIQSGIAKFENEIKELEQSIDRNYKNRTNLVFDNGEKKVLLRTLTKDSLALLFSKEIYPLYSGFTELSLHSNISSDDFLIYGYVYQDWLSDISNLLKDIEIKTRINGIKRNIEKLNKHFSDDKKADDEVDSLLSF